MTTVAFEISGDNFQKKVNSFIQQNFGSHKKKTFDKSHLYFVESKSGFLHRNSDSLSVFEVTFQSENAYIEITSGGGYSAYGGFFTGSPSRTRSKTYYKLFEDFTQKNNLKIIKCSRRK